MQAVSAFLVGLLFGVGLILSGMTDPSKVIGFLDLAGGWDPSLALVMGGAVVVGLIAYRFARKRTAAVLGGAMHLPSGRDIDRRLMLGSLAFGIGWGLGGFCPGPAVVSFGSGNDKAVVFLVAMLAGMALYEIADRRSARAAREGR